MFAKPPPPGFAFGMSRARDPEGAKDVTMKWVEHKLPPSALPGPDFVAMNKLAAVNDVVTAKETAAFRSENHVTLPAERAGARRKLPPSRLPSDRDPEHAYGRSSSAPSAEETRYGDSVSAKQVVNGEFADEWKAMNRWRAEKMAEKAARHARKTAGGPKLTRAALGHAAAAAARTRGESSSRSSSTSSARSRAGSGREWTKTVSVTRGERTEVTAQQVCQERFVPYRGRHRTLPFSSPPENQVFSSRPLLVVTVARVPRVAA